MKKKLFKIGVLVSLMSCLVSCEEISRYEETSIQVNSAVAQPEAVLKQQIKLSLEDSIQPWDAARVVAGSRSKTSFNAGDLNTTFKRLAGAAVISGDNQFQTKTASSENGTQTLAGAKGQTFLSKNADGSLVRLTAPYKRFDGKTAALSETQSGKAVRNISLKLGIPQEELGEIYTSPVGEFYNRQMKVIAQHARAKRMVNGIEVKNSVVMTTFNMDGSLFRMTANWPEFKVNSKAQLVSREAAISALANHIQGNVISKLKSIDGDKFDQGNVQTMSKMEYVYSPATKTYEPTLLVGFENTQKEDHAYPVAVRYNLTNSRIEDLDTQADAADL
ncbi:MAG: hypothetical protein JXR76_24915 [Deltaproteobacteria bacterium]|nr:hypothetical protein [Deltaproteobacteria bacterium]